MNEVIKVNSFFSLFVYVFVHLYCYIVLYLYYTFYIWYFEISAERTVDYVAVMDVLLNQILCE